MSFLRSQPQTYRGTLRFPPPERRGADPPAVSFDEEGPEQLLNAFEDHALPAIQKAIAWSRSGGELTWEELDAEAGRLRRRRTPVAGELRFEVTADELGVELLLPKVEARPWVALQPGLEPGADRRARLGWVAGEPVFTWRYAETDGRRKIELVWSLAGLPDAWARSLVPADDEPVSCRVDDGTACPLKASVSGGLRLAGDLVVTANEPRPARRRFRLVPPLAVVDEDEAGPGGFDDEVLATLEAIDFRARIAGRATHFVAVDEFPRTFEAELLTAPEVLLPDRLPGDTFAGVSWPLEVRERDPATASYRGAAVAARRWLLTSETGEGAATPARWQDVLWDGEPPAIVCCPAGRGDELRIEVLESRRARVTWNVGANADDSLLLTTVPQWRPVAHRRELAAAIEAGAYDYAPGVQAEIDGLEERFTVDESSELPAQRLILGPDSWSVRDPLGRAVEAAETLGLVGGNVRWRPPAAAAEGPRTPTDWTGGSAPALVIDRSGSGQPGSGQPGSGQVERWGALYAPVPVPWERLREIPPVAGDDAREAGPRVAGPRDLTLEPTTAPRSLWLSLWGFVGRYDRVELSFAHHRGRRQVVAWIADAGLPLFPPPGDFLLRSLAPLYAVRVSQPWTFRFRTTARPTLEIGARLLAPERGPRFELGPETRCRTQVADADTPPQSFGPSGIPGTLVRWPRVGDRVLWCAVDAIPEPGSIPGRMRVLLSWDAGNRWRFRGFYSPPREAVELGRVRFRGDGAERSVLLGAGLGSRARPFTLELGEQLRWSGNTPKAVKEQVTDEMIQRWEETFALRAADKPEPLAGYAYRLRPGEMVLEFYRQERSSPIDQVLAIRAWEPDDDAGPEPAEAIRRVGQEPGSRRRERPDRPRTSLRRAAVDGSRSAAPPAAPPRQLEAPPSREIVEEPAVRVLGDAEPAAAEPVARLLGEDLDISRDNDDELRPQEAVRRLAADDELPAADGEDVGDDEEIPRMLGAEDDDSDDDW